VTAIVFATAGGMPETLDVDIADFNKGDYLMLALP
jgi:hypothetical protein